MTECLTQCGLDKSNVLGWRIDHELKHLDEAEYEKVASELPPHLVSAPARGQRMVNFSPLTVLMPGARHRSPGICTSVPNLLLAGEVIYSPDLTLFVPTMEKAACSGYLAARQIMNMVASHAAPLRIDFRDPPHLRFCGGWTDGFGAAADDRQTGRHLQPHQPPCRRRAT